MSDDNNAAPAADDKSQLSLDQLQARIDALEGMKGKAVDESKAEREKRQALEARLAKYEEDEKLRSEEAAKKAGEWDKLKQQSEAEKAELKAKLDATLKANALKDGLAAINLVPSTREFVESRFGGQVTIEGDSALIDGKSPAEFFKAWAETDAAKPFIQNGSSGGGAGGGSGSGASKAKKLSEMTPTEEAAHLNKLQRTDPDAYQAARKELGYG